MSLTADAYVREHGVPVAEPQPTQLDRELAAVRPIGVGVDDQRMSSSRPSPVMAYTFLSGRPLCSTRCASTHLSDSMRPSTL